MHNERSQQPYTKVSFACNYFSILSIFNHGARLDPIERKIVKQDWTFIFVYQKKFNPPFVYYRSCIRNCSSRDHTKLYCIYTFIHIHTKRPKSRKAKSSRVVQKLFCPCCRYTYTFLRLAVFYSLEYVQYILWDLFFSSPEGFTTSN